MATSEASFVASLVAVCAAYRSVSWKVLLSAGLVYGTAYAVEWLMWTNGAKERATKRQFASHAASAGLSPEWRTHLTDLCREQVQICKKSQKIGCVIPHCNLQCGITQPILQIF